MSRVVAGLLVGGLLGHLIAAQVGGGSEIAYLHHVGGFFLIVVITGIPILGLTRLLWRRQYDRALLVFAVVQFVLGVTVAVQEWRKH